MLAPNFREVVERPGAPGNGNKPAAAAHATDANGKSAESSYERNQARVQNQQVVQYMHAVLSDSQREMVRLRNNMSRTYWLLIILSTLMFFIGAAFISAPIWSSLVGGMDLPRILGTAGMGVVDLVVLYMLRPWLEIKKLMADMSQLTFAGDCFQLRVALRLLAVDSEQRATFSEASQHIETVTKDAVKMIKVYFEREVDKELGEERLRPAAAPAAAQQRS